MIDHVDGIRTLQNRSTMLSPLKGDGILVKVRRVSLHGHCTHECWHAFHGALPLLREASAEKAAQRNMQALWACLHFTARDCGSASHAAML